MNQFPELLQILCIFAPEIFGVWCVALLIIFGICTRSNWPQAGYTEAIFLMTVIGLSGIMALLYNNELSWYIYQPLSDTDYDYYSIGGNIVRYHSSYLTAIIRFSIVLLTLICLSLHRAYFSTLSEDKMWEYGILIFIITISMLIVTNAQDLILAGVALECQSLLLYVVISMKRYSNLSVEAAARYFMAGAFSACLMLLGISVIYLTTGCTDLPRVCLILHECENMPKMYLSVVLLLAGFLFKFALVPLQFWIADVYQGSFGYFASYMAMVTKFPTLVLFMKCVLYVWVGILYMDTLIKWIAIISLIVSCLYMVGELNFKRFWAVSSISHMSYIILALSLGDYQGVGIGFLYLFIYLVSALGVWTIILRMKKNPSHDITLTEFFTRLPRLSVIRNHQNMLTLFVVFLFLSAAGVPPGAGFIPKFLLFWKFYNQSEFILVTVMFIAQIVSTAYYLRVIRFALFKTPSDPTALENYTLPTWLETAVFVSTVLINVLFVYYFIDLMVWMECISWNFVQGLLGKL